MLRRASGPVADRAGPDRDARPETRAPGSGRAALVAGPLVLFALMLARWAMGLPGLCHLPYWYLSYSEGFIRRAFVGTLTMPLLVGRPLGEVMAIVAAFGGAASIALLAILVAGSGRQRALDAIPLAFVFSSALPSLARDLGTLDPFLVLAAVAAFLLTERGSLAAPALCAVAPLIHEGALFLLMPLLGGLFVLRPERRALAVAGAFAAGIAALALWLFSTTDFAWPAGMAMPVGREFVEWELGQRFHLFVPAITPDIVLFAIAPCALMAALAGRRAGRLRAAGVVAGALLTWSVTAIAYDNERLFAWGPVTAFLLAELAQRANRRRPSAVVQP